MTPSSVSTAIINYPGAMTSAITGIQEHFQLANVICRENNVAVSFKTRIIDIDELDRDQKAQEAPYTVVILPPALEDQFYLSPDEKLLAWLGHQHNKGSIICSVCGGAFILAKTGLVKGRKMTTHWALANDFSTRFPEVKLDSNKLLINDSDIISAGGLMSWIDLVLELVSQFSNSLVMRKLGKYLIVDTASREQSYYQTFTPRLDHGDEAILKAQHQLQRQFQSTVMVKQLAKFTHLTERTFLRRFVKATGLKPIEYLQQLRIQKACELIETSRDSVESIALAVGYEDISAFRKTFIKIIGQTPKEFKKRFVRNIPSVNDHTV